MTIFIIFAGYVGFCVLWAWGWNRYYEKRWASGKGVAGAEGVPAAVVMLLPVLPPIMALVALARGVQRFVAVLRQRSTD